MKESVKIGLMVVVLLSINGVASSRYVKSKDAYQAIKVQGRVNKKTKKSIGNKKQEQKYVRPELFRLEQGTAQARRFATSNPQSIFTIPIELQVFSQGVRKTYQKHRQRISEEAFQSYLIGNAKFAMKMMLLFSFLYASYTVANDVIEKFTDALFTKEAFNDLYNAPEFEKYKDETLQIIEKALARGDFSDQIEPVLTAQDITKRYFYQIFKGGITEMEDIVIELSPSLYRSYKLMHDMGFAIGTQVGFLSNVLSSVNLMNLCVGIPILGVILYSFFKYQSAAARGMQDISWQEELLNAYNTFAEDFSTYGLFSDEDRLFVQEFIEAYKNLDTNHVLSIITSAMRGAEVVYSAYSSERVQKYLTDFSVATNEVNYDPSVIPPLLENIQNIIRHKDDILREEFNVLPNNQKRALATWIFMPISEAEKLQQRALREFLSRDVLLRIKHQQVD